VRRLAPRPLSAALAPLVGSLTPATPLACIQQLWPEAAGPAIAAAARPLSLHDGVLEVACEAAVWAQELELVGGVLIERLNAALAEPLVRELRCRTG
jgi:predicted nucleic acid-binding Zn ribbon protein